ncbi:3-keto-5-aminohexanoate cleavage protein [Coralliovum pocilloporae]|uniref:3-keto-5-aminohexanoate cleavage protein n=1 Tax=Coralliovum pocilloporae TaxID=3066369 RepID=UPI003307A543
MALPRLMVAPNGARRTKADHPALPLTIADSVEAAKACHKAGADGLHLHIRDNKGGHLLDSGLYREALAELNLAVPDMAIQITTEAVGLYSPPEQRQVALETGADLVSVSIREMTSDGDHQSARTFYAACAERTIAVQHILYSDTDIRLLSEVLPSELLTDDTLQLLYVLGRYTPGQVSTPDDLAPFLKATETLGIRPDWGICAFGVAETPCLLYAASLGGKLRVGFENSLWNADGSVARDNAERVKEVVNGLSGL